MQSQKAAFKQMEDRGNCRDEGRKVSKTRKMGDVKACRGEACARWKFRQTVQIQHENHSHVVVKLDFLFLGNQCIFFRQPFWGGQEHDKGACKLRL